MNDENTGFAACALYNAIKLHFTTDSYDYFKYNGKSNVTKEQFAKKKDRFYFHKLSRKYRFDELREFLVSNFLSRTVKWAGDLLDEEATSVHLKRQKTLQSLTYLFEQDIIYLKELLQDKEPSELLRVVNGDYPILLKEFMYNNIKIETVCIMENLLHFTRMWSERINDTIIWPAKRTVILKYTPFLKFDRDECRKIMREHLL